MTIFTVVKWTISFAKKKESLLPMKNQEIFAQIGTKEG
jgi:hypothetical protein